MKTIIGTGIFNWDSISVREYPQGPQRNRIFDEKLVVEKLPIRNVIECTSHYHTFLQPLPTRASHQKFCCAEGPEDTLLLKLNPS